MDSATLSSDYDPDSLLYRGEIRINYHQVESQSPSDVPPADRRVALRKAAKAAAQLARNRRDDSD